MWPPVSPRWTDIGHLAFTHHLPGAGTELGLGKMCSTVLRAQLCAGKKRDEHVGAGQCEHATGEARGASENHGIGAQLGWARGSSKTS